MEYYDIKSVISNAYNITREFYPEIKIPLNHENLNDDTKIILRRTKSDDGDEEIVAVMNVKTFGNEIIKGGKLETPSERGVPQQSIKASNPQFITQSKKKHWSMKYKRTIDCNRPHGFSQKQHCKYGITATENKGPIKKNT